MNGLIPDTRDQPGLEVAPHYGLETVLLYVDKYPVNPRKYPDHPLTATSSPTLTEKQTPKSAPSRICGLLPRTFWIVFIVILVVLGAATGGCVVGGLSLSHKDKSVSTPPQSPNVVSSSTSASSTNSPASSFSAGPSSSTDSSSLTDSSSSPGSFSSTGLSSPGSSSSTNSSFSTGSSSSTGLSSLTSSPPSASSSPSTRSPSSTSTSTGVPQSSTAPGTYRIINAMANTALDLSHGNPLNDSVIQGWVYDPNASPDDAFYNHQSWQIIPVGGGATIISNTGTNSYVTALSNLTAGANPPDGHQASIYGGQPGNSADPYAQWNMVTNSDNSVSFFSKAYATKLLDLTGGFSTNGTPVVVWEQNGGLNQKWKMLPT